jgi:hypothetical protein
MSHCRLLIDHILETYLPHANGPETQDFWAVFWHPFLESNFYAFGGNLGTRIRTDSKSRPRSSIMYLNKREKG